MQTFLPSSNYLQSAMWLDDLRLNKQITETLQIVNALGKTSGGWVNHPAVKMWRGYESSLYLYGSVMHAVWLNRGKNEHKSGVELMRLCHESGSLLCPPWNGNQEFHSSHRARLLHKGNIDVVRKRLRDFTKDKYAVDNMIFVLYNIREVRDLQVAHVADLNDFLDKQGVPNYPNHYAQFNWAEEPSDTYIWPVTEV